jgi:tetratricopeptide (TPR) repeat protein
MPPEIRERAEEMLRTGEPKVVRREVRHSWQPSDGEPPPEVLEAIRQQFPGATPKWTGKSIRIRKRSVGKKILLILAVLLAGITPALIKLWGTTREPRGLRHFEKALAELEAAQQKKPDDLDLAMRLAEAYARKLTLIRTLEGLKRSGLESTGELAEQANSRLSDMERHTGVSATQAELSATARKGEELALRLLALADVPATDRGTLHVLLGHFLLAQGRTAEAEQASDRAAELDPADVRPHLLNAAICEETEQYSRGIQENEAALSKLAAWFEKSPSSLQYLDFTAGLSPGTDENALRSSRGKTEEVLRQSIEMHILLLRTLARVQKVRS